MYNLYVLYRAFTHIPFLKPLYKCGIVYLMRLQNMFGSNDGVRTLCLLTFCSGSINGSVYLDW